MAIANSVDLTTVTRLYTAFFNRAPDTAGLSFWSNALANGASISTVTQGFLTAPEGVSQYPAFQNAEQFVSAFYTKVFGRAADAEGLAFWTAALNNLGGAESTAAKAALASQIISVVSTPLSAADAALPANEQTVADRALFANKVEIGTYLAVNSAVSVEDAGKVFAGDYPVENGTPISEEISSVDDAKAAFFNEQIIDGTGNIVGSDSNDIFNVGSGFGTTRTIDGGKGIDTLTLTGSAFATPADNQFTNIEIIRLAGTSGNINVSKFVGSTDVIAAGVSVSTISGLAGKTLTVGAGNNSFTAAYGDTATTAAIKLDAATGTNTLTLDGTKLATATVSGSGSLNVVGSPTSLTTLNVASTGTITIAADANVTLIDASASTGAVKATVGANQAYTGGSGVDTVTLSATPSKAITGGAGDNDVLVVNGTATAVVLNAGITGFETLGFGTLATGGYDAANFKHLLVSGTVAGDLIANNVAAGTDVTITASSGKSFTYDLANKAGTSDAVTLKLSSADVLAAGTFTAAGVETINITNTDTNTTANAANTLTLATADATSIVVTGNTGLNLTNTAAVKVTSFDASGVTAGGVTYVSANTTVNASVSIKGAAAGANDLTGNNATNDTIVGGAGDDIIRGTAGKDMLTGGAGNDTFILAQNTSTATGGSSLTFSTITDATTGDKLDLGALTKGAALTTFTQTTSVETATYADLLDLAVAGNVTTDSIAHWFQFSGDTYIVVDNSTTATFEQGFDQVVKLTGLVDLSTSTLAADVLTIA